MWLALGWSFLISDCITGPLWCGDSLWSGQPAVEGSGPSQKIQWNLSIEDTSGTQLAVLYTVEPLYRGHHWDPAGCPVYSGTSP